MKLTPENLKRIADAKHLLAQAEFRKVQRSIKRARSKARKQDARTHGITPAGKGRPPRKGGTKNKNSAIFYDGPSMLDGKRIIGIISGFTDGSNNGKTGETMLQTYILRADVHPVEAIRNGEHQSICGVGERGCSMMGLGSPESIAAVGRTCYVEVAKAATSMWHAYHNGSYNTLDLAQCNGMIIRCGSYGDPAAIPTAVWMAMLANARRWTGYTHQWQWCDPTLQTMMMASCDTESECSLAESMGWRYFFVRTSTEPLDKTRVIACPASAEMDHRTTCDQCVLCQGTASGAKSIAILPHGTNKGALIPLAELRSAIAASTRKPILLTVAQ